MITTEINHGKFYGYFITPPPAPLRLGEGSKSELSDPEGLMLVLKIYFPLTAFASV